jgi:uncharacterized protein (DUF169 family)
MVSNRDYAVLKEFDFKYQPVGVKFFPARPGGIKKLGKPLSMCEMVKEASTNSKPFYVSGPDFVCFEKMLLGFEDPEPILVSGLFGASDRLFREARACRRMYDYLPYMKKGSVHSVGFSAMDKLPFDPDVLVIVADTLQAQTLLRAINYSTGEPITARFMPVCMCAWMLNYPIQTGKMNFFITGLGLGMQQLAVYPPGLFVISVPWPQIDTLLDNLREMGENKFNAYKGPGPGGEAHRKKVDKLAAGLRKKIVG